MPYLLFISMLHVHGNNPRDQFFKFLWLLHWIYLQQFDNYQGLLFDLGSVNKVSSHRRWSNDLWRGSDNYVLHSSTIDELINKRPVLVLQ